jgi:phosphoribosylaminoimidazole carboxylase PurE protein
VSSKQTKVVIFLGSSSDLPVTEDGTALLKRFEIPYSLRMCSAHRTPEPLHRIIKDVEAETTSGGPIYVCVAGMSAHLAGVVASLTLRPVLAVPVYRAETAGFDSLLSMGQMPKGIPVGTMGFGKHGFVNACLHALQMLALADEGMARRLADHRQEMARQVVEDDQRHRQDFRG